MLSASWPQLFPAQAKISLDSKIISLVYVLLFERAKLLYELVCPLLSHSITHSLRGLTVFSMEYDSTIKITTEKYLFELFAHLFDVLSSFSFERIKMSSYFSLLKCVCLSVFLYD